MGAPKSALKPQKGLHNGKESRFTKRSKRPWS